MQILCYLFLLLPRWFSVIALTSLLAGSHAFADTSLALEEPIRANDQVSLVVEKGLSTIEKEGADIVSEAFKDARTDLPGLAKPQQATVYLVKQQRTMRTLSPPSSPPPDWAQGVTYPNLNRIIVAIRREHEPLEWEGTLRHEIAHLVLNSAIPIRVPRWLDEGFAFLHARDLSMDRVRILTGMAWSGRPLPLSQLEKNFPSSQQAANRAYAQSYDFVSFLARRGRHSDHADDGDRWAFRDFLIALADGSTTEEASMSVYHAPLATLEKEWYDDLRKRYWMLPVGLFGGFLWLCASFILILAFHRKRKIAKAKLAQWAKDEAKMDESPMD